MHEKRGFLEVMTRCCGLDRISLSLSSWKPFKSVGREMAAVGKLGCYANARREEWDRCDGFADASPSALHAPRQPRAHARNGCYDPRKSVDNGRSCELSISPPSPPLFFRWTHAFSSTGSTLWFDKTHLEKLVVRCKETMANKANRTRVN